MPYASSQTEQMERSVHIWLAQRIEHCPDDIRSSPAYQPPKSRTGTHLCQMIHQRLHSYENAGSHSYITNGFQVTVFFQFLETQYKTDDSRQPDKRENSPSPTACVPHDEQCKRGVRPRNVQIDRPVIEFAKQFLQLTRTAAVIPGGADIRRQHAKQIDGYTSYRPLRFDTRRRFREQDISGYDSK